jgi:hypothetical protein
MVVGRRPGTIGNTHSSDSKLTQANTPVGLLIYWNLDDKCEPLQFVIKVPTAPRYGRVEVRDAVYSDDYVKARLFSPQNASDARVHCSNPSFAAKEVVYTPTPGYAGQESVDIEIDDHEYVRTMHFDIGVENFR